MYEWTQTSFVLSFLVYVTEHNALGFIRAVDCVRIAFLSGWTTFIVWMDHGLLVRSSVEGPREYLHSSLTSCNICGITSESPMMIQKSLTTSYFINFFYFETHQSSEEGKNACELHLCLGMNALGYSFYFPCVCYPSLCSAGRLTGRHAPAMGHLPPRPGLGATHPGRLGSPGRIPTPAGEGGACAGRWGQA